jgi:prevent-host-death family protein
MEISATDFKAKCLSLMEFVQEKQEEVIITKHGRPIAKLVPVDKEKKKASPVGFLQGKLTMNEDIVKPIDISWRF